MSCLSLTFISDFDKNLFKGIQCCKSTPFSDQSLMSFATHTTKVSRQFTYCDISDMKHQISFKRNGRGQLYLTQELGAAIHGTLPTQSIHSFNKHMYPSKSPYDVTHVPTHLNYVSGDQSICVINRNAKSNFWGNDFVDDPILEDQDTVINDCESLITDMFKYGNLANSFTFKDKKRASVRTPNIDPTSLSDEKDPSIVSISSKDSTSSRIQNKKKRKWKRFGANKTRTSKTSKSTSTHPDVLPTILVGWSTQNCHEYSSHKCTTAGNVRPALRDGNLSDASKRLLLQTIQRLLKTLPAKTCFNIDMEPDKVVMKMRKSMMCTFQKMLGGSDSYDGSFRVEGITITIPSAIGLHRDVLNCNQDGMSSVASINVNIPITDETVPPESELRKWLNENGYFTSFPVSIILYSRKMVYHHAHKMSKSLQLAKGNRLNKTINWLLLNRVGSVIDYHTSVWCNKEYINSFMTLAKKKTNSRFKGRMITTTETLDKMVSA